MSDTDQAERLGVRLIGLVRSVALGGLAGAITGAVVLGVGGRLVMFASRLLHPEALGRATENGNRVGEFTIEGTVELIIFGGVLSGVIAGVIWVLVRQWIPANPVIVGLGAVSIGGFFLIQADNTDFFILQDPRIDLVLLVGLIFVFGVSLYSIDRWLDTKMADPAGTTGIVVYTIMIALGSPLVIPTFANMFSKDFCFCSNPPIWTGVFLTATSIATIVWWVQHLRGADTPSKNLETIGRTSLALTVVAGAVHLTSEIIHIL